MFICIGFAESDILKSKKVVAEGTVFANTLLESSLEEEKNNFEGYSGDDWSISISCTVYTSSSHETTDTSISTKSSLEELSTEFKGEGRTSIQQIIMNELSTIVAEIIQKERFERVKIGRERRESNATR